MELLVDEAHKDGVDEPRRAPPSGVLHTLRVRDTGEVDEGELVMRLALD
jgi:hypothetical protein